MYGEKSWLTEYSKFVYLDFPTHLGTILNALHIWYFSNERLMKSPFCLSLSLYIIWYSYFILCRLLHKNFQKSRNKGVSEIM